MAIGKKTPEKAAAWAWHEARRFCVFMPWQMHRALRSAVGEGRASSAVPVTWGARVLCKLISWGALRWLVLVPEGLMASELLGCGARGEGCQGWDRTAFAFFSRSQRGEWQGAVCLRKGKQALTAFQFQEAVSGDTAVILALPLGARCWKSLPSFS